MSGCDYCDFVVVVVDDGWISFACKDGDRERGNLEKGCWLNMS